MIDIIIPTYKNPAGLVKTLSSIDFTNNELEVTIVDDASCLDYNDIKLQFPQVKNWIYLSTNGGPGCARQRGIEFTVNPYIMFLDTGDYFLSSDVQSEVIQTVKQDSQTYIFMWHFTDGKNISKSTNNHLHGKVYKRDFLKTYDISFSEKGSYANEDIGFNRACRMIIRDLEEKHARTYLKDIKKSIIMWARDDENSLTLQNNHAFSYEKQNMGLALNMIHTYDIIKKTAVNNFILYEEISEIMGHLYFGFVCTLIERPEFINQSWEGAKLFYDNVFVRETIDEDIVQAGCSRVITRLYKRFNNKLPFPVNVKRFIRELKENNKIPNYYLTFLVN